MFNTWYNILAFIALMCGVIIYGALLLSEKLRTIYPLNYILLALSFISLWAGVRFLYNDYVSFLISFAITAVISAIVIALCWKLSNLTTKGLIIFVTIASVLAFSGFILLYFRERIYVRILAGLCLCSAATLILFTAVCGLKNQLEKLSSRFMRILEFFNIFVTIIGLFAAISMCFD
ncbi:unnamed protein product [Trichobilharzia szidati]|nr:unnamed protein product [Trichobilharzia szidati]